MLDNLSFNENISKEDVIAILTEYRKNMYLNLS
jgi:hypothetical protein